MKLHTIVRGLLAVSSLALCAGVWARGHDDGLPPLPADVPVEDLPDGVLQPASRIHGWILRDNRAAMKNHAWELFRAVMKPRYEKDGATVRLFDTWHDLDEIVPPVGAPVIGFGTGRRLHRDSRHLRHLRAASQSAHGLRAGTPRSHLSLSDAVVSDVKYNPAIGRLIEQDLMNQVISPETGQAMVAGYNLSARIVPGEATGVNFEDTRAVMLKPAFTIIKGKGPTVIARWEESANVTNPRSVATYELPQNANRTVGSERTWTQEAVVYPTTGQGWPSPTTYYGRDGKIIARPTNLARLPRFTLTDFHYVRLDAAQAESLRTGILSELMGPNVENIEEGDYAVLTSMHIATREVEDWTWQTFWWQPIGGESLADNGVPAALRALFESDPGYKPLKHFRAGVGYSYATRRGEAVIASNPYLEGSFGLPADLATVFGPEANTDGVNVFLRNAQDVPLDHEGTSYVHAPPYGLRTNCITCHRAAAYPVDSVGQLPGDTRGVYPDWGVLNGDESLFVGRVKTHFLWGLTNKVSAREIEALAKGLSQP